MQITSRTFKNAIVATCLLATAASLSLFAQRTSSEKNHETDTVSRGPAAPLNRQGSVLDIVKLKGSIGKVDLERRTITIVSKKNKGGDVELSFSQPAGREQIDVSKKAAKLLGKKNMELEELKPGSAVKLRYYSSLMQVMDLTVE